jgi:F-type H+-transporting ATPase subunit b
MRHSFGLNTNILETNIVNLAVVLGIVITVVGDALQTLLDQRKQKILSVLIDMTENEIEVQTRLLEVYSSSLRFLENAYETDKNRIEIATREGLILEQNMQNERKRAADTLLQETRVLYWRTKNAVIHTLVERSLCSAEEHLIKQLNQSPSRGANEVEKYMNHRDRNKASKRLLAALMLN